MVSLLVHINCSGTISSADDNCNVYIWCVGERVCVRVINTITETETEREKERESVCVCV